MRLRFTAPLAIAAGIAAHACTSHPNVRFVGAPSAPTFVVASAFNAAATIAWTANPADEGITSFRLYRADQPWENWDPTAPGATVTSNLACCAANVTGLANE